MTGQVIKLIYKSLDKMKISEIILALEAIKTEHGDLDTYTNLGWDIVPIDGVYRKLKVEELVELTPRESKLRFKNEYDLNKNRKVICKVVKF